MTGLVSSLKEKERNSVSLPTVRVQRVPSVNQEEGVHWKSDHAGTLISGFLPLELCLRHRVCGIR